MTEFNLNNTMRKLRSLYDKLKKNFGSAQNSFYDCAKCPIQKYHYPDCSLCYQLEAIVNAWDQRAPAKHRQKINQGRK